MIKEISAVVSKKGRSCTISAHRDNPVKTKELALVIHVFDSYFVENSKRITLFRKDGEIIGRFYTDSVVEVE